MSHDRPPEEKARARCPEALTARRQRLDDLKRRIRRGEYETEDKMVTALRRMLSDLRGVASGRRRPSREDESADGSP